jgi:N6-L-threonylcarbamoyladenine synthase
MVGIHHLEGHIHAVKLENPGLAYPAVALVASGGHTALYDLPHRKKIEGIGKTRDDAAGEAFDKVARLLGLGYPGGPPVEDWAARGDEKAIPLPLPKMADKSLDFSFSGIKTAVMRYIRENGIPPAAENDAPGSRRDIADIAASFQRCAVAYLVRQTLTAAAEYGASSVLASGGVLCNRRLRETLKNQGESKGFRVYCSSPALSTDNAVMVAALGYEKIREGIRHGLDHAASASLAMSG